MFFILHYVIIIKILHHIKYVLSITDNEIVKKLWSGEWTIENHDLCKQLLSTKLESDALVKELKQHHNAENKMGEFLHVAISAFLTFCDRNWNPHPDKLSIEQYLGSEWPKDLDVLVKMQRDSEPMYTNILHPELLYFSTQIFSALYAVNQSLVS